MIQWLKSPFSIKGFKVQYVFSNFFFFMNQIDEKNRSLHNFFNLDVLERKIFSLGKIK